MNIETLLQAAQILENQQTKIHRTNDECSTPTTSVIKTEQYSPNHLHYNLQNFIQQQQQHRQFDDNDDEIDNNSDLPARNQTACFRDREIHNRLEKYRRAHLKDCFDTLKSEVPCQRDRKITNLQVLNLAIKYIQSLKRKDREYENEIQSLTYRNIELQQRLRTLKAELNSEGHNVDTWLNSCPDIDQSVSTRSASEAEMYRTFDDIDDVEQKSILPEQNPNTIDSKILSDNNRKTKQQKSRLAIKKHLTSIPTTNLLQTLTQSENFIASNHTQHRLLTTVKDKISSTLTPINDIRYDIVDMFTKGQQTSTLPSIASLMNRHASPIVSPIKQTIGMNADVLTTSTTNILHQPVATS